MRKASSVAETGNSAEAIDLFYKALEKNPAWAKAHLELALLYHDIDQVSAIYHYRKYLSLRPETEKRAMIEGRINAAEFVLISDAVSKFEKENAELKLTVGRLEAELKAARIAETEKTEKSIIYKVQAGDTLSGIAARVYNDREKWKIIYNANKVELAGLESLKVGQTLVVPGIAGSKTN